MTDEFYMRRAIELAKKGRGWTNPNPMVGAVIVKNGSIIGEGYHEKCGELHAERNAIASLTESAEGATLYVTLECPAKEQRFYARQASGWKRISCAKNVMR